MTSEPCFDVEVAEEVRVQNQFLVQFFCVSPLWWGTGDV